MDDGGMMSLRCSGDQNQQLSDDSIDGLINELLMQDTQGCTHIHTCTSNPPGGGPHESHTHTCFHVHTSNLIPRPASPMTHGGSRPRPLGNREAVRRYRQKNKAGTASLKDELLRLKAVNQQLLRRLQLRAALEAEVARLKCLLVDVRGRIEGEIRSYCNVVPPCVFNAQAFSASDCQTLNCFANPSGGVHATQNSEERSLQ